MSEKVTRRVWLCEGCKVKITMTSRKGMLRRLWPHGWIHWGGSKGGGLGAWCERCKFTRNIVRKGDHD